VSLKQRKNSWKGKKQKKKLKRGRKGTKTRPGKAKARGVQVTGRACVSGADQNQDELRKGKPIREERVIQKERTRNILNN